MVSVDLEREREERKKGKGKISLEFMVKHNHDKPLFVLLDLGHNWWLSGFSHPRGGGVKL